MRIAKDLMQKYGLVRDSYYTQSPYANKDSVENKRALEREAELSKKWADRIEPGFYGFSLAPAPLIWFDVIDEFLEYTKGKCENFKIMQIKVKFSGIRIYLSEIDDEIMQGCRDLESILIDQYLYY